MDYNELSAKFVLNILGCRRNVTGSEYSGTVNITKSGRDCMNWTDAASELNFLFPLGSASTASNLCTNPLPELELLPQGVWCFHSLNLSSLSSCAGQYRCGEYCDVPLCSK